MTAFSRMFACAPEKFRPLSIDDRISPMPNSPMTATRNLKPLSSTSWSNVMRSWPVTLSRPTVARANPSVMEASVLNGEPRPMPMKLANVRNCTAKNSGGPNLSANLATSGARNVMTMTATMAPTKEDVNAAVSASSALPFCAIGWPSKVVANRPRLAWNIE